jgi:succinate dehydrogenase/fumarate reductase cytochrome b subunit
MNKEVTGTSLLAYPAIIIIIIIIIVCCHFMQGIYKYATETTHYQIYRYTLTQLYYINMYLKSK